MPVKRAEVPIHDPKAALERALREEYLQAHGLDARTLESLPPDERARIGREVSLYVAARLAEVDARASYVHDVHGASSSD